jgi:hypothetical protein
MPFASFVVSTASTRLFRISKETGRPFPQVSDDDVIDFMVAEAVTLKVLAEDDQARKKAEKEREREEFKKNRESLKKHQ